MTPMLDAESSLAFSERNFVEEEGKTDDVRLPRE